MKHSNRLRVLIISKQYPPTIGGGGSHAFYLSNELSLSKDVEVHVLTSKIINMPSVQPMRNKNLTIYRVDFGHTESLHYESAIKRGLQICQKVNPHIIHGQHIAGSLIGLYLKSAFDKPLVITLHKTPMLQWNRERLKDAPIYCYLNFLFKSEATDAFVAGSKAYKKELRRFGVSSDKIKLIYHGVPIKWFRSAAYEEDAPVIEKIGLQPNETLIVCPSRLDARRKELDVFVKAAGELKNRLTEKKFVFLIAGDANNPEEMKYKRDLENLADSYQIKNYLRFKTFTFREMPIVYRLAKACILPSITEGLGLVLIEALTIPIPVIGTNTLGVREVIKTHKKHGLLFEVGDYNELATHLSELFSDRDLYKKIMKEGHKRIKNYFDSKLMAKSHLELYEQLITK